eukprot:8145176-Lingulodinium_polyedra.AAC.1
MIGSQHPALARDAMSKAWYANCNGWDTTATVTPARRCQLPGDAGTRHDPAKCQSDALARA